MYFLFKSYFYMVYVGHFPDEIVHISYIASVEIQNSVVPDFRNMKILASPSAPASTNSLNDKLGYSGFYTFTNTTNYLGHPPLYYQLMRLSGGVEIHKQANGSYSVAIHILRLRVFSLFLASIALFLFFYVGYKKLGPSPFIHLLYAATAVSVPMLTYDCAGVNNDTLAFLGVAIFVLGMMRFLDRKRNVETYLIVAAGICTSFLAKLTAGFLVTVTLAVILLGLLIRERNLRFLISPQFLVTVPLYLITACYFLAVRMQVGTINPQLANIDYQGYLHSGFYTAPAARVAANVGYFGTGRVNLVVYGMKYWDSFALTWTGIWSHVAIIKNTVPLTSVFQIGLLSLWVLPLLAFVLLSARKKYPELSLYLGGYFAVLLVAVSQFFRAYQQFRYVSGYLGGFQSRYYLCFAPVLSMAIAAGVGCLFNKAPMLHLKNQKLAQTFCLTRRAVIGLFCISFSLLLMFEDFGYFLLTFRDYA